MQLESYLRDVADDEQQHGLNGKPFWREPSREPRHEKRSRPMRKRGGSNRNVIKPGGIRQRRNKRWSW